MAIISSLVNIIKQALGWLKRGLVWFGYKLFSIIWRIIITILKNPISWTTLFAPLLFNLNNLRLHNSLAQPLIPSKEHFLDLSNLVTVNKWADALVDINIQYVVLLVAFIFTISQVAVAIWEVHRNHSLENIGKLWSENESAKLCFIISMIIIFGGMLIFVTGILISPEQIEKYKINSANPLFTLGGFHPPPLLSKISISRFVLILYGWYLTRFFYKILPGIIGVSQNTTQPLDEGLDETSIETNEKAT